MFVNHCINGENDFTSTMDNKVAISIKHDMGIKGSIFLKSYFESIIKETLQKECNTRVTDNSLITKF